MKQKRKLRIPWVTPALILMVHQQQIPLMEAYQATASTRIKPSATAANSRITRFTVMNSISSSTSLGYSMADGGYIDSETQKTSDEQLDINMADFDGRIVEWFHKTGDFVNEGEAILCVESMSEDSNGFRVNMDISAPKSGYLAARYKKEKDNVNAKQVVAVIVPDQKSMANFVPHSSSGGNTSSGGKSWWATPYQPGRPDPFTAKSPLGEDKEDVITVSAASSASSTTTESPSVTSSASSDPPVSVIKGSRLISNNSNGPRKMVEIAPSPSDPFQHGGSYDEQTDVPPPSKRPSERTTGFGQEPPRARIQPPLNDDIFERRRNNIQNRATAVDTVHVTYANESRTRTTDGDLKSAAVPSYGSDEQSSISSDDSRVQYANDDTKRKPRKPRKTPSGTIDADVIPSSPSYGSDEQSSIPASTNAFFQRPPNSNRQRKRNRKRARSGFEQSPPPAFYSNEDDYSFEDPSIQSVFPQQQQQRSSLPTQSGGSMSLWENSLPTRSNLNQDRPSNPYFFQSDEENNSVDFVDYLEARGMRDASNGYNVPMIPQNYQQQQFQQLSWEQQQQQLQWQRQAMMANPAYRKSIITRAKNRTPPTKYDIAASTLGGSLLGASIGIAAVANPDLGLNLVENSAMLPPVLWATMIGTVGYAGGIADNDAGYSIRHVFSLGNSLKTGLKNFVQSARETVEKTAHEALRMVSGQEEPALQMHHVTIKTGDIVSAMEFYSLLGFESKSKFRVGQARATWLENVVVGAGRIELIEVPPDMLEQGGTSSRRALDRVRNQELLGWNHMTLDVSDLMRKKGQASLSEFLGYLNEKSYNEFGKGLRLAVEPQKQAIGDKIYDTAFLYDPDGSMIQLQSLTNERGGDYRISSVYYGEPTGGQGLVDQSGNYQTWW